MSTNSPEIGFRGSNQRLWNLLRGELALVTEDVILAELREHLERLMKGLTYYAPYEGGENEEVISFPAVHSLMSVKDKEEQPSTSDAGTASDGDKTKEQQEAAGKKADQSAVSFNKIRKAVAQNLKLDLAVATDLMVSYMMYEYKGTSTSYNEIAETQLTFNAFLRELKNYYKKERMCVLLCNQAILAELGDKEHRYFAVIESYRSQITYKKWCWGLLRSIALAQDESETVEILHCLALLMHKLPNETIPEFFTYLTKSGFESLRRTERARMAEGTAIYCSIVVSGITDCCTGVFPQDFGGIIRDFLKQNFDAILRNRYNFAPVFACYDIFCKEDPEITNKMKCIKINTSDTFGAMLKLTEHYGKETLYDRHTLSLVMASSIFEVFEVLLSNFDASHFGTSKQAFEIFARILQHNPVAENFLCGTPLALTALYADATTLFPLDIPSTLHLWKSLCMSVRSVDLCNTIVKGVAKLNSLAEYLDDDTTYTIRRLDRHKVMNLRTRILYGIELEEGIHGTLNSMGGNPCVVWELPHSMNVSAFDILHWSIKPIADTLLQMVADNAPQSEFQIFDYSPEDLHAISEFVIQFWKAADEQVLELTKLIHPVCFIMETMLKYKMNVEDRIRLIQDLFGVLGAVNELCAEMTLINYVYDIIPGSDNVSLVEELILGLESVSLSKCEVTVALLDLVSVFSMNEKCWTQGHGSVFETKFLRCIRFIAENIIPSCSRWRIVQNGVRLKMFSKCLEIFYQIFCLEGADWVNLKRESLQYLLGPNSCLVFLLKIEESALVNSIIQPTDDDRALSDVICTALRLLLRIVRFDTKILQPLNHMLDGMLVRLLSRFVRHRLIPTIPTLAIMVLTEIAKGTALSLFSCFIGKDEAAFRDVIIQRLEFPIEDVTLKVSVLEFLTVIAQTQVGIIECFFADGGLEDSILSLIDESEKLAISSLHFIRSLFRQRLPCPKHREDFWRYVLSPIKRVKRGGSLEVVTATFHILTFEAFINGTADRVFVKELETLLSKEKFQVILDAVIAALGEPSVKCVIALKHFFTLLLGRLELSKLVPEDTLELVQDQFLKTIWTVRPKEDELLCSTIAELLVIATTPELSTSGFLSTLLMNLVENFRDHSLAVQLPLLCLLNKCFTQCSSTVQSGDTEKTFRIVKHVFDVSSKMMEMNHAQKMYPVLIVAARILATIIEKQHIDVWGFALQKQMIPMSLIVVTSVAMSKRASASVVANCLSALIALAEHPHGCTLIPTDGLTRGLYLHLAKLTEDGTDVSWSNVILLCVNLNSKLLANQRQEYLDEALSFWGQFSDFLNLKLTVIADLTEICVGIEDTEKGYNDMKTALMSAAFILNDILMLTTYIESWQAISPSEVYKAMRNVFYILQEVCGLLQQPFLLQSSVGQKIRTPSASSVDSRSLPRLHEMQLKLWEICDLCLQIFVRLNAKDEEFVEKVILLPTVFQVGQLCVKVLTKTERRAQPGTTMNTRLSSVLEKVMVIVHRFISPILDDPAVDVKFQAAFRREYSTEVNSLCDGVRRLNLPKHEFLVVVCAKVESKFK